MSENGQYVAGDEVFVLICGWPRNLFAFLKTLCEVSAGVNVRCIVLSLEVPYYDSLSTLSHKDIFPRAVYIAGSALERSDLARAGVAEAHSVVVFAAPHAQEGFAQQSQKSTVKAPGYSIDIESILSIQKIRAMRLRREKSQQQDGPGSICKSLCPGIVVCELKDMSVHLAHLDNTSWVLSEGASRYFESIEYASGCVWMDEILYSLSSMAVPPHLLHDSIVQGIELLELLLDGGKYLYNREGIADDERQPCVQLVSIPEDWVGSTYKGLFLTLHARGIIAIGLYRSFEGAGSGSPNYYVLTNPSKTTTLCCGDCVYVIIGEATGTGTGTAATGEEGPPPKSPSMRPDRWQKTVPTRSCTDVEEAALRASLSRALTGGASGSERQPNSRPGSLSLAAAAAVSASRIAVLGVSRWQLQRQAPCSRLPSPRCRTRTKSLNGLP
eukprot:gnl/TRDRNA2_/TRDRNA2_142617_c0_seq1.p1 gnl/TRDRNA2_/TRDRNA2_142617_c0~~gnl/TRDRNA2_/TRDRNA2_142617_c0_seq1.p1  ORF type:complete len:483 (-),score=74.65 gnl/TRDRNA2_/TRDRNA2_142617_c0_seq1:397-1719(-)